MVMTEFSRPHFKQASLVRMDIRVPKIGTSIRDDRCMQSNVGSLYNNVQREISYTIVFVLNYKSIHPIRSLLVQRVLRGIHGVLIPQIDRISRV